MVSSVLELSPWDFAATITLGAASLLVAWRSAHLLLAGLQIALVGLSLWLLWVVTPSMPMGEFLATQMSTDLEQQQQQQHHSVVSPEPMGHISTLVPPESVSR